MSTATIVELGGSKPNGESSSMGPWTFQNAQVRELVESHLEGRVLNACAGKTELDHDVEIVRNDVDPEREADTRVDVSEATNHFRRKSFDTVVYDPPYDKEQAIEHYNGHRPDEWQARRELVQLVAIGGMMLELGWNTYSISQSRPQFERVETYLLRRSPVHRPVFLTVDRRVQKELVR